MILGQCKVPLDSYLAGSGHQTAGCSQLAVATGNCTLAGAEFSGRPSHNTKGFASTQKCKWDSLVVFLNLESGGRAA